MRLNLVVAAGLLLCAGAAYADPFNISLTNSTLSTTGGGTVTFSGTITGPSDGSTVYVNGETFTTSTGITVDDSAFLNDVIFGQYIYTTGTTYSGDLFDVTVVDPADAPFLGSVAVVGGATDSSQDLLATLDFTVDVGSPTSVTPEPSSFALLGTGLLGVAGVVRRRLA